MLYILLFIIIISWLFMKIYQEEMKKKDQGKIDDKLGSDYDNKYSKYFIYVILSIILLPPIAY